MSRNRPFHPILYLLMPLLLLAARSLAEEAPRLELRAGTFTVAELQRLEPAAMRLGGDGSGLAVALFARGDSAEQHQTVTESGARVLGPLSCGAWLIEASPSGLEALRSDTRLAWAGPWLPQWTLPPDFAQIADAVTTGTEEWTALGIDKGLGRRLTASGFVLRSHRLEPTGWYHTQFQAPVDTLQRLALEPGVFYIERRPDYQPQGERASQVTAGNHLPGDHSARGPGYRAWLDKYGLRGAPDAVVMLQDDGLEQGDASGVAGSAHPDLLGRILDNLNLTEEPNAASDGGHGSINASIMLGSAVLGTVDPEGFLLGQGLAPLARVVNVRIFDSQRVFSLDDWSFSDTAAWASRRGARFNNNSWGATVSGRYTVESALFDALVRDADHGQAGHQPMHIFFSTGNSGPAGQSLATPASAKNIVAVGAVENGDRDGAGRCRLGPRSSDSISQVAGFSSRGPARDGRYGVTVVAPGVHIQGIASTSSNFLADLVCDPFWPTDQTDYARSSGTSHSVPQVCAAAMLIDEFFGLHLASRGFPRRPSPALMRAVLTNTADDLGGRPDNDQGWGRVNLSNFFDEAASVDMIDQSLLFEAEGEEWSTMVQAVDPERPLRVTLAWTDAPGNPASAFTLVNDLDLRLLAGGQYYLGNGLKGFSYSPSPRDFLNNLEAVFIERPGSGAHALRIDSTRLRGDGVPGNGVALDQDFALFVTNGRFVRERASLLLSPARLGPQGLLEILAQTPDADGAVLVELSTSSGDREAARLASLPLQSLFRSGFTSTTVSSSPLPGNDWLELRPGDVVTARLEHAGEWIEQQVGVDLEGPVLKSFMVEEVLQDSITVAVTTSEPSSVTLRLRGLQPAGEEHRAQTQLRTIHRLTLDGLSSRTLWALELRLEDAAGNYGDSPSGLWSATLGEKLVSLEDFQTSPSLEWVSKRRYGSTDWEQLPFEYDPGQGAVMEINPQDKDPMDVSLVGPWTQLEGLLRFQHAFGMLSGHDGGLLELQMEGRSDWIDLGPWMREGEYRISLPVTIDSPIAGRPAWTAGPRRPVILKPVEVLMQPFAGNRGRLRYRFVADAFSISSPWVVDDVARHALEFEPLALGQLRIRGDYFRDGERLELELTDTNALPETVWVSLRTESAGDEELLHLEALGSGRHGGSVLLQAGHRAFYGDGVLQGAEEDVILARYEDRDRGDGGWQRVEDRAWLDNRAPDFDGLAAASGGDGFVALAWGGARDGTPGNICYAVYRSETPGGQDFDAPPRAEGLLARNWYDYQVENGKRYYYVVRARDLFDQRETNRVERSARPYGEGDLIEHYFESILGRSPGETEVETALEAHALFPLFQDISRRYLLLDLARALFDSEEYRAAGHNWDDTVARAHQALLFRPPDAEEAALWAARSGALDRLLFALGWSDAYRAELADRIGLNTGLPERDYLALLHGTLRRAPLDEDSLTSGLLRLDGDHDDEVAVRRLILEDYLPAPLLPDRGTEEQVQVLHLLLLGRAAEEIEAGLWATLIEAGVADWADLVDILMASAEFWPWFGRFFPQPLEPYTGQGLPLPLPALVRGWQVYH